MRLDEFDYELPEELIAQHPLQRRDASRMLLLERVSGRFSDDWFVNFASVLRGDELMVLNNAKVIPARLFARREAATKASGEAGCAERRLWPARIEVLLVRRLDGAEWEALVKPGRKVRTGEVLCFEGSGLTAEVTGRGQYGLRRLRFCQCENFFEEIQRGGHVPLPPYIRRADQPADRERYQTVFAKRPGAVAAPTAGLHFTPEMLERVRARGVQICEITLDVGLGTFQPVHASEIDQHIMHSEDYEIPPETAEAVAQARAAGRPVLAIGTTVVRALEDAAQKALSRGAPAFKIAPGRASSSLFIKPGYRFELTSQLLTNFHLPRSTLLMLVAAFAGRENILNAYRHAVEQRYRFYSYGDCMVIS